MARPKKQNPPEKEHFIGLRVTNDLYEVMCKESESAGMNLSEYLRYIAVHHRIVYRAPIIHNNKPLISYLAKMNKLGNNMNQIAHHLNAGLPLTESLAKELHTTLQALDLMIIHCNQALEAEYGNNKTHRD